MLQEDLYKLTEKFNILMNVEQQDKERFKNIVIWAGDMMDMTVKEKYSRNIHVYRAEIWTVNFGENVGSEINKIRPALVVSCDFGNTKSPTVTVIPITSKEPRQHTHVEITEDDLIYVENVIKGTVTAEGIRNVSKARLGRRIAKVNEEFMKKVEHALLLSLGIRDAENEQSTEVAMA